jgi:hypothetical protein
VARTRVFAAFALLGTHGISMLKFVLRQSTSVAHALMRAAFTLV